MQLYYTYPNWKRNALTFSFDGGSDNDARIAEILRSFGLKATFFLPPSPIAVDVYEGHEIALLGSNSCTSEGLLAERKTLENTVGLPIRGFALPLGYNGDNNGDALRSAGFVYARLGYCHRSLLPVPYDWMNWGPSSRLRDEKLAKFAESLCSPDAWGGCLRLLNVTGVTAEFDKECFARLEKLCREISGRDNVWYATNIEIRDYVEAGKSVRISMDGTIAENLSAITLYANYGDDHGNRNATQVELRPSEEINVAKPDDKVVRTTSPIDANCVYDGGAFSLAYPNWKLKALTFSYDDGPAGDRHLVDILNRHRMKGTFNLNSDGRDEKLPANAECENGWPKTGVTKSEWTSLYLKAGHEVAVHGAQHGTYNVTPYPCIVDDIYRNRLELERWTGHPVRGMAYPCGAHARTDIGDRVLSALGIVYSRNVGVDSELRFDLPDNFMNWMPTAHHDGGIAEIGRKFLAINNTDRPRLCYIWGHTFEFDRHNNWEVMEEFCDIMANHEEIWYATNIEIYEYITAARSLIWSTDRSSVINPSAFNIYGFVNDKPCVIPAGYGM